MNKLEKEIIAQYKKQYFSVQQISENTNLAASKVRYVLGKFNIEKRNISEAIRYLNITKFKKEKFSIKNNLNSCEEKLKIAGVMLYWGEGTKNGNTVAFSNSDPEMISFFLKFLRKVCNISEKRIRALLHVYENQDESKLKKYWAKKTGIPSDQFSKSFVHKKKAGSYRKNSDFGTISLRYSDKELLKIINNWTKEYIGKL
jgi:hypothetical protein